MNAGLKTCGNEYVAEVIRGAHLLYSIRVKFNSIEETQKFDSNFSVAGPMASTSITLQTATAQLSKDTRIVVSGLQIGGDVSKLTQVFSASAKGRTNFIQSPPNFTRNAAVTLR